MESRDSSGDIRYRVLSKLLKVILTIVHGNADVERSLSENKKVLTKERSLMTDASLNAIRTTKHAVRVIGSASVENMPITSGYFVLVIWPMRLIKREWLKRSQKWRKKTGERCNKKK